MFSVVKVKNFGLHNQKLQHQHSYLLHLVLILVF